MTVDKEKGTVKYYDPQRGFGFISRRGSPDVHVGHKEVKKAGLDYLNQGDMVRFKVLETRRGPSAKDLEVYSPLGDDYLRQGYFYYKEGSEKSYLHLELVDALAMDIASILGSQEMKTHQLRRFFNKARGIENKLDRDPDHEFEAVKADIYSFRRDVAYQVGRGLAPEAFQRFIDCNVELAIQDEHSFRQGFLQHFESVLAFFVYLFRE